MTSDNSIETEINKLRLEIIELSCQAQDISSKYRHTSMPDPLYNDMREMRREANIKMTKMVSLIFRHNIFPRLDLPEGAEFRINSYCNLPDAFLDGVLPIKTIINYGSGDILQQVRFICLIGDIIAFDARFDFKDTGSSFNSAYRGEVSLTVEVDHRKRVYSISKPDKAIAYMQSGIERACNMASTDMKMERRLRTVVKNASRVMDLIQGSVGQEITLRTIDTWKDHNRGGQYLMCEITGDAYGKEGNVKINVLFGFVGQAEAFTIQGYDMKVNVLLDQPMEVVL